MPSLTDAWARHLASWEAVPPSFLAQVDVTTPCPYVLYAPPDAWGQRKVNARLLVLTEDTITVMEDHQGVVTAYAFTFADIDYVEQGAILLYSWLAISGRSEGRPLRVQVEYNAVVKGLFSHIVDTIRRKTLSPPLAPAAPTADQLPWLKTYDYKFWNYGHYSLLPGEVVQAALYQPECSESFWLLLRRRLTVAYLMLLTEQELIILEDDASMDTKSKGCYGIIVKYIARRALRGLVVAPSARPQMDVICLALASSSLEMPLDKDVANTSVWQTLATGIKTQLLTNETPGHSETALCSQSHVF